MKSRLRNLLLTYGILSIVVSGYSLGTIVQGATNPPNLTATPSVSLESGVTFVYPNYANLTMPAMTFALNITWNPAVGPGWCFDGYCLNVSKSPAAYPSAIVNMNVWQPAVTQGRVALMSISGPPGMGVTVTITHFSPITSMTVLKDTGFFSSFATTAQGQGSFTWYSGKDNYGLFEIDAVGNAGTGGGFPNFPFIRPAFLWRTAFDLFDASADEVVYFEDQSIVRNATSTPTYLWNFGDGNFSSVKDPVHRYAYGAVSASFNVTEFVCLGSQCNATASTVTLMRSHLFLLVAVIVFTGVASVMAVWRWRR